MHQQSFQIEDSDHRVDIPKHVQLQEPDLKHLRNSGSTPSTQPIQGAQVESPRISHQQLLYQCLVEELDVVELRI